MNDTCSVRDLLLKIEGREEPLTLRIHARGTPNPTVVLLLHGPAGAFQSFADLLDFFDHERYCIIPELIGFGGSSLSALTYSEHVSILQQMIAELKLQDITLAGHHTGGRLALELLAQNGATGRKISKLILIGNPTVTENPPRELNSLTTVSERNTLLRYADNELTAYLLLSPFFFDPVKISEKLLLNTATIIGRPGARKAMIASAGFFALPPTEEFFTALQTAAVPVLLIQGEEDPLNHASDIRKLRLAVSAMRRESIASCSSAPHLEAPAECAALMEDFFDLHIEPVQPVRTAAEAPKPTESYSLRMRKLIDRWSVSTILLLAVLKFLQLLKKCGLKPSENGWRKVTGIFLGNEYSKFTLASFRLRYAPAYANVTTPIEAKRILSTKLGAFLQQEPSFRWSAVPHSLSLHRKRLAFCDIVVVELDEHNQMKSVIPLLDRANALDEIPSDLMRETLEQFVHLYNSLPDIDSRARTKKLSRRLTRFAMKRAGFNYSTQMLVHMLIDRMMTATFLYMDVLKPGEDPLRARLATPNFRIQRNPGWGMLNIIARFTPDLAEVDLWFQCHHVPVDGVPMQELLDKLKRTWGSFGTLKFPALDSPAAKPEVVYCGQRVFRARVFEDFSFFLRVRDHVNRHYAKEMGGSATIASMLIWGLAQHNFFKSRKMFFPVDTSELAGPRGERELSLVFIRPASFFNERDRLGSFLAFQREFNQQLRETRFGRSESYEMLDVVSLTHPIAYKMARMLVPDALSEIVGTVGVSVIRQAEMFISPLSDFNVHGFMALCNIATPTEDGKTAGAVSICASRDLIHSYLAAVGMIARRYHHFLNIPRETIEEGKSHD